MPIPEWVQRWHKIGNHHADLLATEACKMYDIPEEVAQPVVERVAELKLIQKRISSIICHMPNRPKEKRPPKVLRRVPTIDEVLCTSSHTVSPTWASFAMLAKAGRVTCVSCNAVCSSSVGTSRLKAFLLQNASHASRIQIPESIVQSKIIMQYHTLRIHWYCQAKLIYAQHVGAKQQRDCTS